MKLHTAMLPLLALPGTSFAWTQEKPSIVFMMVDNLGWGEIGAFGGGIPRGAEEPPIPTGTPGPYTPQKG